MTTRFWEIKAAKNDEAELFIYDVIGDPSYFGDSLSAKEFAADLRANAKNAKTIHLRIDSPGGSVWEGIAIKNILREHPAKIRATVDGVCGSIATVVVAGAADEINMGDNTQWIIHNPSGGVMGESKDMRRTADALDKVKGEILDVYHRRTGQSKEHLSDLMDTETWFSADEAVEFGFADKVMKDAPRLAASIGKFNLESMFKNCPKELSRTVQARAKLDAILRKGA